MENRELLETFLFKNRLNQTSVIDLFKYFSHETISLIYTDLQSNYKIQEQKLSEEDIVMVFTDGGCINNGKYNARAAYSVYSKTLPDLNISKRLLENPTNQRAELSAIYAALDIIQKTSDLFVDKIIIIYTDSAYSIKCITEWSKSWKHNGWKTANKKPVKNMELIQSICNILELINCKIQFKHVFSHTSQPKKPKDSLDYQIWLGNKIVDENIQKLLKG